MGTPKSLQLVENLGGREGIRTPDLSVANAALSQLSYTPDLACVRNSIARVA